MDITTIYKNVKKSLKNLATKTPYIGSSLLILSFSPSIAFSQTVYPELDEIVNCTQTYIKNNTDFIIQKKEPIVLSGNSLGPCTLNSTSLNDYQLIIVKSNEDNQIQIHGYLITKNVIGDNELADIKTLAKTSKGFRPGYLDNNYNAITYYTEKKVSLGVIDDILIEKTTPLINQKKSINNYRLFIVDVVLNISN